MIAFGRLLEPCSDAMRAKFVTTVQMCPRLQDSLGVFDANRVVTYGALFRRGRRRRILMGCFFALLLAGYGVCGRLHCWFGICSLALV
jgi:hypothetical protein